MGRRVQLLLPSGARVQVDHDGELNEVSLTVTSTTGSVSSARFDRDDARIIAAALTPLKGPS